MPADIKNVILQKKIGNTVYEVHPKTDTTMVQVDTTTTLDTKLTSLDGSISAINDPSTGILAQANAYTDTQMATIASAFQFKGKVNYVDLLPASNNRDGDVYQVAYRGSSTDAGTDPLNAEYAWSSTDNAWIELGSIIDLSSYYTAAQVDSAISTAITTYDTNTVQPALATKAVIYLQATQPDTLTEADLWMQDVTPSPEP